MTCKFVNGKALAAVLMVAGLTVSGCHTASTNSGDKEHWTMNATNRIRFEHVAINVEDPVAMAEWYCENVGMRMVRQGPPPANARFISDAGGNMMMEIYHNPPDAVPDYAAMDPLVLHIAFMVDDVKGICRELVAAGATVAQETYTTDSGDEIAMLRDPWGVPIQFLKRANPMLSND
ncbi:MAG: VOC family protein [Phycisphaerales bacterium]|nr:MAG: VOC family protein [Phycisphaerales bacterium]